MWKFSRWLENQLEPQCFDELSETVESGVTALGEHPEQVLSVKTRLLGQLTKPAVDLGDVADGKEKCPFIRIFKTGIEISDGVFWVFEAAEQIVVIADGGFHCLVLLR